MNRADPQSARALKVWDLPTRLFHWLLVAAVAVAWLSSEEDSALAAWHQAAGWMAGLLIVFRLIWGLVGGEHARFADEHGTAVWQWVVVWKAQLSAIRLMSGAVVPRQGQFVARCPCRSRKPVRYFAARRPDFVAQRRSIGFDRNRSGEL